MPRSGHRGALITWSKMITAEAETSEKSPKGAIETSFPKIFKSCQRKASEHLMGKTLAAWALRYPHLRLGAASFAAPCAAVASPPHLPHSRGNVHPCPQMVVALQQVSGQENAEVWGWGWEAADRRQVRECACTPSHLSWGRCFVDSKRKQERWILGIFPLVV